MKQLKSTKKSLISKIYNYLFSRKIPILIAIFYTVIVSVVLLNRFWQFEAFYFDQGYYESAIWNISQFKAPIVVHPALGTVNIFADHFVPSIFILSPIYWLTQSYLVTIVAIPIIAGLSVIVAYEIGQKFVKDKILIYALLFAYMFYIGLQNALIFYVHPITLMILPLMLLFWSIFNNKFKLYYILLLFNLGFQETEVALLFTLGIFLYFFNDKWKKHGVYTMLLALSYGLIVTRIIQPLFSPIHKYYYEPQWSQIFNEFFIRFIKPITKIQAVFVSFSTFGFLPIFSLAFLPMILQDFFLRFVLGTNNPLRQDLGEHYNANIAVLMFVSSILTINKIQKTNLYQKYKHVLAIVIILIVAIFHRIILRGPFGLAYNPVFYKQTFSQDFMWNFLDRIPHGGKIMTQNNLALFFTHENYYIFKDCERIVEVDPDTIAIDFRDGQNANNMFPSNQDEMTKIATILKNSSAYKILFSEKQRYIFTRDRSRPLDIVCPKDLNA